MLVYFHQYELITLSSHTSVIVHRLSKTPVSQRSNIMLEEHNFRFHNFIIFANTMMCRVPFPMTQGENRRFVSGIKRFNWVRNANCNFSIVLTFVKLVLSRTRYGFGANKSVQRLGYLLEY